MPRSVQRVVRAVETMEGAGFRVHRPFPARGLEHVDPFLLLDEMGPVETAAGEAKGAPDHPHRGFETVTYLLEGAVEHEDSAGHKGRIGPGDVQWMTAGAGIVHSEMPGADIRERGGRIHGFQLWVNLPRRDKMMRPRYQEIPGERIPEGRTADGQIVVKVIAGEALGARAVIDTRTPITYLDVRAVAGARGEMPVPAGHRGFVYVYEGHGRFGERDVARGEMGMLDDGPGEIGFEAGPAGVRFLVITGQPLREPIARYGPFVMSTQGEILQALEDFRTGRLGMR
jgi:quercetin 2,3-dioxygenase